MKVLQINTVCGIGSTGRIVTDICELLKSGGDESIVFYGREPILNCENSKPVGNKWDMYKHILRTRVFDGHGLGSYSPTQRLINQIIEADPDVIHLHNIHGYYVHIKSLFEYLRKSGKPIVWTLHDCWPFTGHCSHFDYCGCDRWLTGCFDCPQKTRYPKSFFLDRSKRNYTLKKEVFSGVENMTIVTPSQWLSGLVNRSFLKGCSVKVIPNGVDLSVFNAKSSRLREVYNLGGKFIILGVASVWDGRKGLRFFEELSVKLESDSMIVLVGLSEKQIAELPRGIIGISKTHDVKELAEWYYVADVFVNPTLEDNFPTTNLEALASGTPIVTFDTGGSPESVDDSSGYVVEKGNGDELFSCVMEVKKKKKSYYSESCRKRAERKYNKVKRFADYIDLYKAVLT